MVTGWKKFAVHKNIFVWLPDEVWGHIYRQNIGVLIVVDFVIDDLIAVLKVFINLENVTFVWSFKDLADAIL